VVDLLQNEKRYLSQLLEAVQRCSYFLYESSSKLEWPLSGESLWHRRKDAELFETLAAINERFAKLQDTLASTMRHSALLMSENTDNFLKILVYFEKRGVVPSVELWQQGRMARNMAAHDYETDYSLIAEHFNVLSELTPMLLVTAGHLVEICKNELKLNAEPGDFNDEFASLLRSIELSKK
jgi:hypothetical protein